MSFDVLFALIVYRNGEVRWQGRPKGPFREMAPATLRDIANWIESGDGLILREDEGEVFYE